MIKAIDAHQLNFNKEASRLINDIERNILDSDSKRVVYKLKPIHEFVDVDTNPEHKHNVDLMNYAYRVLKGNGYNVVFGGLNEGGIVYRTLVIEFDNPIINPTSTIMMSNSKGKDNYTDLYIFTNNGWATSIIVKIGNSRGFEETFTTEYDNENRLTIENIIKRYHSAGFELVELED